MTKTSKQTRILSLVLSLMMVLSLFSVTGTVTASAEGEIYTMSLSPKAEERGVGQQPSGDLVSGKSYILYFSSYSGEIIITKEDDPTELVPITDSYGTYVKQFIMPDYNIKVWEGEDYYKEFYDYTPSAEDPSMHIKTSKSDPENSETEKHTFGSDYKCVYCGAEAISHSVEWTTAAESSRQEVYCATTSTDLESFDTLCEDFYYYILKLPTPKPPNTIEIKPKNSKKYTYLHETANNLRR